MRPVIQVRERKYLDKKREGANSLYLLKCSECLEKEWSSDLFGLVVVSPYVVQNTPMHYVGKYQEFGVCAFKIVVAGMDCLLDMFKNMESLRGELTDRELALSRWCVEFILCVFTRYEMDKE